MTTDKENSNLFESCGERGRGGQVRRKEYLGLQNKEGFLHVTSVTWIWKKIRVFGLSPHGHDMTL